LAPTTRFGILPVVIVSLDEWLKRRALANQASGAARTAVVCEADGLIGYYALASGSVTIAAAPGRCRRNMPEPIPVVVLARLADDRAYHGRGLGRALVRGAARRAVHRASDDWAAGSANAQRAGIHGMSRKDESWQIIGALPLPLRVLVIVLA
jgi:GNAT superfamily N-acetyltransferase